MAETALHVIVPIAIREVFAQLTRGFPAPLTITHMLNPEVPGYVAGGAAYDLALSNPWHIEAMQQAGHAAPGSLRAFVRTPLAFGGARARDRVARTPSDIAALLAEAERIGFSAKGTSGGQYRALLEMLDGEVEAVLAKSVGLPGGGPMRALLAGELDLICLPLTNIAPVEGAFVHGICPDDLRVHVDIALCRAPNAAPMAAALADWLCAPERDAALQALGGWRYAA